MHTPSYWLDTYRSVTIIHNLIHLKNLAQLILYWTMKQRELNQIRDTKSTDWAKLCQGVIKRLGLAKRKYFSPLITGSLVVSNTFQGHTTRCFHYKLC